MLKNPYKYLILAIELKKLILATSLFSVNKKGAIFAPSPIVD